VRVVGVFLALAILAATAVFGIQGALAGAGDRQQIDGETFTPVVGSAVSLERSNLGADVYYNDSVAVVDENGDTAYEGRDYRWLERNGTIVALAGGNLDGDSSATVDYDYRRTTQTQQELAALASQVPRSISYILPLGFVLGGLLAIRGLL
jgi:hypothetical protein